MSTQSQRDELLQDTLAKVVQLLSLAPNDSLAHTVTLTSNNGLRVALQDAHRPTLYAYALPWSRGWSIFMSTDPEAASFSWRDVPANLAKWSRALHAPRDRPGPHYVKPEVIAQNLMVLVEHLDTLRARRTHKRERRTI